MLTDTHCHLDFDKFDDDREAVIRRAIDMGVKRILIPALDYESSLAAIRLADAYADIFAAVGFHPTDLDKWDAESLKNLRKLIAGPQLEGSLPKHKLVAIGEIGLDYYWVKESEKRDFQQAVLRQQLRLAQEVNLPVILHMREENDAWFGAASADLLEILSEWQAALLEASHPLAEKPGVLHSYNGNLETAQEALALNFYIGITGPVTYKNAEEKREIVRQLPLERLLIETDSPFLTPVPHRGRRNEPAFVVHIADKIAEIHRTTREQVARVTYQNANRLFGWEADS